MFATSARNTVIGVFLVWSVGIVCGLASAPYFIHPDPSDDSSLGLFPLSGNWPTAEMASRGSWVGLIFGLAIALPSGLVNNTVC